MIDFGVAWDKLAQFETADEIADFFQQDGVKGFRGQANRCAIARWMSDTTGQAVYVSIQETWTDSFEDTWLDRKTKEHTAAMVEFVKNFDEGLYRELLTDHPYNTLTTEELVEMLEAE